VKNIPNSDIKRMYFEKGLEAREAIAVNIFNRAMLLQNLLKPITPSHSMIIRMAK